MIVGAPGQPATPTVTRVAPGSLVVSFAPPGNGGAPILRYAVTCISSNGGVTKTAVRGARRIVVRVLTAGKTYKCAVTATNGRGVGPASVASAEINA
ncbi:MAG: Fibronectin type domain [Actinomycetota bacterium]|nr:Fibronectin type domain [Actinomycetota bacterium]